VGVVFSGGWGLKVKNKKWRPVECSTSRFITKEKNKGKGKGWEKIAHVKIMQKVKKTKKICGKNTHTLVKRARGKTAHTLMHATAEMERIKLIFLLFCHLLHLPASSHSRFSFKDNRKVARRRGWVKVGGRKWVGESGWRPKGDPPERQHC